MGFVRLAIGCLQSDHFDRTGIGICDAIVSKDLEIQV
jgi:hypothetical protein